MNLIKSLQANFGDGKDIREHFHSVMCDLRFHDPAVSQHRHQIEAVIEVVRSRWMVVVCDVLGHEWETDGHDYPESGGEGFTCNRCGMTHTAWH